MFSAGEGKLVAPLRQQFHTAEQSYAVSSRALEPAKHISLVFHPSKEVLAPGRLISFGTELS